MDKKKILNNLNDILSKWQKIVDIKDDEEREIEMSMYCEEMPFQEIKGLLDLYNQEVRKNKIKNEYLRLLVDIGYDYDGLSKPKDLKALIDELVGIAVKAIENDDKSVMTIGSTPKNILGEKIEEKGVDKNGIQ